MVTKTKSEVDIQDEVIVEIPKAEISDEANEKAQKIIDKYTAFLTERTEAYMHRMSEEVEVTPEAATPVLPSGYQYWNCYTVGPYQLTGTPAYQPTNILEANQECLMAAVIWVNPINGPGASLPGTVVLGARNYRFSFETVNITDVSNGPDFSGNRVFNSPASVVTVIPWIFRSIDPGPTPKLYETHLTLDVLIPGQPLAAFASWHADPSVEPPFLGRPSMGPHWQFERPARYLVYRN